MAKPRPFTYRIEGDCWICTSHKPNKRGYPRAHRNGVLQPIYRFVYEASNGPIPLGMHIRHTCDEPRCINPEHLETGTHADNMRDKIERGRQSRGERVNTVKLTPDQVRAIRADRITPAVILGETYGCTGSNIRSIRNGASWRHLLSANEPR